MQSVEELIHLREEAIQKLLDERAHLETDIEMLTARLSEITEKLARLGHYVARPLFAVQVQEQGFSFESFLAQLAPQTREPARQLHQGVLSLGTMRPNFGKHRIAYFAGRRFAVIEPRRSQLAVRIMTGADLDDPKGWTRDQEGHAHGRERIFYVTRVEDVEYAMHLIGQVYRQVSEK